MQKDSQEIEVVTGDGKNLTISPVYNHLNVARPKVKEEKKKNIIIPEEKKKSNTKDKKRTIQWIIRFLCFCHYIMNNFFCDIWLYFPIN